MTHWSWRGVSVLLLMLLQTPAFARIVIDVRGVSGPERENVLTFLSVERNKDRRDLDADTVQRMFNRIDEEIGNALRPFGFYAPQIESAYREEGQDWRVDITITPGTPVTLEAVNLTIEGPGADSGIFDSMRAQTMLVAGNRLLHADYDRVRNELTRIAESNGYLDARLLQNQLLVDADAHTARVDLRLSTGDQYHFGEVTIQQSVIRPDLMERFLRFRTGEAYSTDLLLRTQFALDDSLYFANLEVVPGARDPETLSVPISITADRGRRRLTFSLGYGTDTATRGTVGWIDSRVNDRGHRFRSEIRASSIQRSAEARYDIPIGDPALEKFSLLALVQREERADVQTVENSLTPSLTQVFGRWQRVISLGLTHTTTDDGALNSTANLLVPGIAFARVPQGFLGETLFTRPFFIELKGSHSALGSDSDFLQLHIQAERAIALWPKWSMLLRAELGASTVRNFEELPGIYRFFAGGDRSVRGFGYDSLSPEVQVLQPDGSIAFKKTGGRHLAIGSAELVRELPRNLAISAFVDAGNAFNEWGDKLEYSAGVGMRFRLPGISLGIDIAQPLSQNGSPRLHLNISPQL
ncbi:MAG: BamA/TamA family outer membrane protein [Nevskiaceae bacterium]|jgi:translocation and assembly module TamA|nr:BamA/TamA family outer membrane protein [Nevskiaceae bacterium]